ncbi:GGDEF domain-containing protein, partial [Aeromonas dhakensis]|nr:GGDEF domain-containing protein [Aeromonas dhakensis]MDM5083243.1 GGDEF domain-containing protein [Aeromonas dhakensis]
MMTPSYSRMTNLLFWSLLLGSLLAILAILAFEFGPERRLDILSQAGIAARAQDDRSHGGHSVTTLLA